MIYVQQDAQYVRVRKYHCADCGSFNTAVTREANAVTYLCMDCGVSVTRRRVRQCPSCGSTELYYEAGLITGQKYHCKRCDYIGPLVFEKEIEERKGA